MKKEKWQYFIKRLYEETKNINTGKLSVDSFLEELVNYGFTKEDLISLLDMIRKTLKNTEVTIH